MRTLVPIAGLLVAAGTVLAFLGAVVFALETDRALRPMLWGIAAIAILNLGTAAGLVRRGPGSALLRGLHLGVAALLVLGPWALTSLSTGFGRIELCEVHLGALSRWASLAAAWVLALGGLVLLSSRRLWWLALPALPLVAWCQDTAGARVDVSGDIRWCSSLRACRTVAQWEERLIEDIVVTPDRVRLVREAPHPTIELSPPLLRRWEPDRIELELVADCK